MAAPMKQCSPTLLATTFRFLRGRHINVNHTQRFHTLPSSSYFNLDRNGASCSCSLQWTKRSGQVGGHRPGTSLTRCWDQRLKSVKHFSNFYSNSHQYLKHTNKLANSRCDKALHAALFGGSQSFFAPRPWAGSVALAVREYRARRGGEPGEDGEAGGARRYREPTPAEWEDSALMLRMAVENGFLSWMRNSYIMTVAGVTMYCQDSIPFAQEASVVLLLAAGLKLTTGTGLYVHSLATRRRRMAMAGLSAAALGMLSVVHLLLWVGAMMVYLGYVEELDDPVLMEELEEELKKEHDRRHRLPHATKRINDKYD